MAPQIRLLQNNEAELVEKLNKQKDIDKSYYTKLVDEAVKDISQYDDFEWFVS